ncbi:flagellar basal body rod protein FlgC [Beijerinckia indica]|uniref:Flagellar basal-body rod protein FlgC n=1 Tax=Beijerinckia indica subsp. indica (strain ATCC 9039 / DSM 1715 / NCIMB 8712) TaxID=395963 RepID=B2IGW1_BEII9|nr:flagellar basal body rod protein FlgC [Beijerinckia indica]ACB97207.1 flagellar basal-body rod protein FlgC [Beijerinckia indica subsp. indica ATCC 9039]
MIDPLKASMKIAGSGLEAQSTRLRVISENMANSESTGTTAGANPYQRKTVTFSSEMDRLSGLDLVQIKSIGKDTTPFQREHDPGNPAADDKGFVKRPNVNILIEMADMREANRSYEANLQVLKQARDLSTMTIDLLRS